MSRNAAYGEYGRLGEPFLNYTYNSRKVIIGPSNYQFTNPSLNHNGRVQIHVWGAGGGAGVGTGNGSNAYAGGGGGGGGYAYAQWNNVSAGSTFLIQLGSIGISTNLGAGPSAGGTSLVTYYPTPGVASTETIFATGGAGGANATPTAVGSGGTGGFGFIPSTFRISGIGSTVTGGFGANGNVRPANTVAGAGGGAAGHYFGVGGAGGYSSTTVGGGGGGIGNAVGAAGSGGLANHPVIDGGGIAPYLSWRAATPSYFINTNFGGSFTFDTTFSPANVKSSGEYAPGFGNNPTTNSYFGTPAFQSSKEDPYNNFGLKVFTSSLGNVDWWNPWEMAGGLNPSVSSVGSTAIGCGNYNAISGWFGGASGAASGGTVIPAVIGGGGGGGSTPVTNGTIGIGGSGGFSIAIIYYNE